MGAAGCDAVLGLLSAGISFDSKRFSKDISLFKPKKARTTAHLRSERSSSRSDV